MDYISKILQPDERVLAVGKMHWIIYKDATLAVLLAAAMFWIAREVKQPEIALGIWAGGWLLVIVGGCIAISAWFEQWITEVAVTNQRVVYKRGFIQRRTAEMNMDKVESVIVTQSILGRLLDYGSVHVKGTGEGIERLHMISRPLKLRNRIVAR